MKRALISPFFTIGQYFVITFLTLLSMMKPLAGNAQVIVPATLVDNQVTPSGRQGYPNCSSIDYTPFNGGTLVNPQLTAVVFGASPNGTAAAVAPELWISDQVSPWLTGALPANATTASFTDVVVGNNTSIGGQYLIAVVYTAASDVWIAMYSTTHTGGGLTAPAFISSTNISNSANVTGPAHIDIIDQYSTLYPAITGLPQANFFVVTWQDVTRGIMEYSATLNTPGTGVPEVINSNTLAHSPDVAAVERLNPATGLYEKWALFTYLENISAIDLVNYYLVYQEMNVTGNVVWPTKVYDIKPFLNTEFPRIDAIDNYQANNPGPEVYPASGPAQEAYFCIAATTATDPTAADIVEYNNVQGAWNATDLSSPPGLGGQLNRSPVVACGPGSNYTVAYNSSTFTSAYAPYFGTSVSQGTGMQNTPGNAYAIPTTATLASPQEGIAIAATSNVSAIGSQYIFPCWVNQNRLYGKYTNTVTYAFRESLGVAGVASPQDYEIMPNPASDYVTLAGPADTYNQYSYKVMDIAGRTVLQAPVTSANERVDISGLANGMYILNVYNGQDINTFKLVKE